MKTILTCILLISSLVVFAGNNKAKGPKGNKGGNKANHAKGNKDVKHNDPKNHAHDFDLGPKKGHLKHHGDHDHEDVTTTKGKPKKGDCNCQECQHKTPIAPINRSPEMDKKPVSKQEHGNPKAHKGKKGKGHAYGRYKVKGNNGLGNGIDPAPPGKAPVNDSTGTPGNPDNKKK